MLSKTFINSRYEVISYFSYLNSILLFFYQFLENVCEENGCSDVFKRIASSSIFDVVLPSIDVYSDFSLILGWFWYGHFEYAISMTFPIILQFLSTIYNWFRLEKNESKKWSWPILLLQFWPQWRAIRIMNIDIKKGRKAEAKRKDLMREVTSAEPFLEAWFSIIIMTIILMTANSGQDIHCFQTESYNLSEKTWNFSSIYSNLSFLH